MSGEVVHILGQMAVAALGLAAYLLVCLFVGRFLRVGRGGEP